MCDTQTQTHTHTPPEQTADFASSQAHTHSHQARVPKELRMQCFYTDFGGKKEEKEKGREEKRRNVQRSARTVCTQNGSGCSRYQHTDSREREREREREKMQCRRMTLD